MSYKLGELPEFKELVVKRKRIRQRQRLYSTQERYAKISEDIRKSAGRAAALEKELGEDPKQAYCFVLGIPRKLTPAEILEFKEAEMKIEYLNKRELKSRLNR